jgi:hypothetical protein
MDGSEAAPRAVGPARRGRAADFALVTIAIVVGTFHREPFSLWNPQFWAEDATVLFADSWKLGPGAVLEPYAGYLLLYQRAFAEAASWLPVALAPAAYVAGNVLAQLLVGWMCLSERFPGPRWARIAAGAAVTLAPAENEVFNKLVNAQWILALAPLVVLAWSSPRSRLERAFDVAIVSVAGLSGPFSVLYLPLFVGFAALRRDRHAWLLLAADAACALVQARHMSYTRTPGDAVASIDHLRVVNGVFGHVVAGSFGRPAPEGTALTLALFALTLAALAALAWRAVALRRPAALVFLAAAVAVLGATLWAFRSLPGPLVEWGDRYWYVPTVATVWAVLAVWDDRSPARRQPVLVAFLVLAFASFLEDARSPHGAAVDLRWEEASRCIGRTHPCVIPVNPPGWSLTLP